MVERLESIVRELKSDLGFEIKGDLTPTSYILEFKSVLHTEIEELIIDKLSSYLAKKNLTLDSFNYENREKSLIISCKHSRDLGLDYN